MSAIHKSTEVLEGRRILIIDDERASVRYLENALKKETGTAGAVDYEEDSSEGVVKAAKGYDVILVDMQLPVMDGFEATKRIREKDDTVVIIGITNKLEFSDVQSINRFQEDCGGDEFVLKFDEPDFKSAGHRDAKAIAAVVRYQEARRTADRWKVIGKLAQAHDLIARSQRTLEVLEQARNFAQQDDPVLILGESGVGKDEFAKVIHKEGPRSTEGFGVIHIPRLVNVASELFGYIKGAFTDAKGDRPGLFEAFNGGTVLLDEIGDMPYKDQAVLLRVLQEGKVCRVGDTVYRDVNVRILAGTLRDLGAMVNEGTFRDDLYGRLNVLRLVIPPLRERPEDIVPLAELFLDNRTAGRRLSPGCERILLNHDWPLNVRELKNTMARADEQARTKKLDSVTPGVLARAIDTTIRRKGEPDKLREMVRYHEGIAEMLTTALMSAGGDLGDAETLLGMGDSVRGRWLRRQVKSLEKAIDGFGERYTALAETVREAV